MRSAFRLTLLVLFWFQHATAQDSSGTKIHNALFNWNIVIPKGFDSVSSEQWAKIQNKGADAVEKTYNQKIVERPKTVFVFKSDQFHYFESNYQPFDTRKDGSYAASCKAVNEIMYKTFAEQMTNVKIDTSSYKETVSNLDFYAFKIRVTFPNSMVLNVLMYSRLFGKKDFSVNIMYMDEAKGKLLLNAWKESKFRL